MSSSSSCFVGVFRSNTQDDSVRRLEEVLLEGSNAWVSGLAHTLHESTHLVVCSEDWAEFEVVGRGQTAPLSCGASGLAIRPSERGNGVRGRAARGESFCRSMGDMLVSQGRRAFRQIDGPFLLALADPLNSNGTMVRDKFGLKRLYYAQEDGRLWFSDALVYLTRLVSGLTVRTQALLEWLHYGIPLEPGTFFNGIASLPAGHILLYDWVRRRVSTEPYFEVVDELCSELRATLRNQGPKELEHVLEQHLRRALRVCSAGRSRVTVLLSGGVDSSILAAMAARDVAVDAVTVDVQGPDAESELRFAAAVARHTHVSHVACPFDADTFRRHVCDTVYALGSPLILESAVALHHAAISGAVPRGQLILDGEGADAAFAGSTSLFRFSMMSYFLSRLLRLSGRRVEQGGAWIRRLLGKVGLATRTSMDTGGLDYMLGARGMERHLKFQRLLQAVDYMTPEPAREISALMLQDFGGHLVPLLLRLEPAARAAGSHVVLPFLESKLFSFSMNLPLEVKLRWGWRQGRPVPKWLLKRLAYRYIPASVIDRPKGGFEIPGGRWIGPFPDQWLEDSWLGAQFGVQSAALKAWLDDVGDSRDRMFFATLEIWGRLFDRKEPLSAVREQWISLPR